MLNRSRYSLWHSKKKNAVIILLFAVIFLANIICMTALRSTEDAVDYMEKNIRNSLTIKQNPILEADGTTNFGISAVFETRENRYEKLENEKFVEQVIYYASGVGVKVQGAKLNEDSQMVQEIEMAEENPNEMFLNAIISTRLVALNETERSSAFTVRGYTLLEGEHLYEDSGKACLISKEFSELNSLKVGDTINVTMDSFGSEAATHDSMEVKGIYQLPQDGEYKNLVSGEFMGGREFIFITLPVYQNLFEDSGFINFTSATVILKDSSYKDEYIDYVKEEYMVVGTYDSHFGNNEYLEPAPQFSNLSNEELNEIYKETLILDIYSNEDWYQMTVSPLEAQIIVFTYIVIGLQIISVVILAILAAILINSRKREIAILLSMGETKAKICVQMILEFIAPLLIAVIIGLTAGILVGNSMTQLFANMVSGVVSTEQAEKNELQIDEYKNDRAVLSEIDPASKILSGYSSDIMIVSNLDVDINTVQISIFAGITLMAALLASLIQTVKIAKLNPAQILINKKE